MKRMHANSKETHYMENKNMNPPTIVKKDVGIMEEVTMIKKIVKRTAPSASMAASSSLRTWVEIAITILESSTRMGHVEYCRTTGAIASITAAMGCLSQIHEEDSTNEERAQQGVRNENKKRRSPLDNDIKEVEAKVGINKTVSNTVASSSKTPSLLMWMRFAVNTTIFKSMDDHVEYA